MKKYEAQAFIYELSKPSKMKNYTEILDWLKDQDQTSERRCLMADIKSRIASLKRFT